MKKIINHTDDILQEMLRGFCYENDALVYKLDTAEVIVTKSEHDDRVSLISGGGSGHEPAHAGFVGDGMLTAAVCGEIFTSPTPDQILEAITSVKNDKGVLLIVKNYSGDIMNFEMAQELAADEGIDVEMVVVNDDIAVEDSTYTTGRRGVAGTVFVHKILGYYAAQGMDLKSLKVMGDTLVKDIKTIGVALDAATVPAVGKKGFELNDQEIEFGVGIHGEPGYHRTAMKPSHELAQEMVQKLKKEFAWSPGDTYGILVNGLGATPYMEQYIFMNDVRSLLEQEGLNIEFKKSGNLMTSLDMEGISLTMILFNNREWINALKSDVNTAAWR